MYIIKKLTKESELYMEEEKSVILKIEVNTN